MVEAPSLKEKKLFWLTVFMAKNVSLRLGGQQHDIRGTE